MKLKIVLVLMLTFCCIQNIKAQKKRLIVGLDLIELFSSDYKLGESGNNIKDDALKPRFQLSLQQDYQIKRGRVLGAKLGYSFIKAQDKNNVFNFNKYHTFSLLAVYGVRLLSVSRRGSLQFDLSGAAGPAYSLGAGDGVNLQTELNFVIHKQFLMVNIGFTHNTKGIKRKVGFPVDNLSKGYLRAGLAYRLK